jgi:hypothetical protein
MSDYSQFWRPTAVRSLHILLLISLALTQVSAQEHDSSTSAATGFYGAPEVRLGTVRNIAGVFVGGRGGWIFDRAYAVGLGGYILTSDVNARSPDSTGQNRMGTSYGGLDFEYFVSTDGVFHVTAQTLVGAGAVSYQQQPYTNERPRLDSFFILEPGLMLDVSVTKVVRLGLGVSYRFVQGLSSHLAINSDLTGPSAILTLKVETM